MRPGDAFDDEMRRHPRTPVPPLDPAMAERLLDGTVHEDDVPPEYRDVLRVLASAAASPSPVPPAEAAALAMFRSTRRPVDPPRRTSVLSKLLGAKAVAAIVLGTAAVGTAAAAATGTLPDAAQAKAHHIVAAVPDATRPVTGPAPTAATPQPAAGGASDHPTLPGVAGLCQAYGSGSGGENGNRLDSTAFGRLADAAGGADKIAAYCRPSRRPRPARPGRRPVTARGLAGACRSWQAADRAGRAPAAAVLDRLTTAAGGADAIAPFCAALVGERDGGGGPAGPALGHPAGGTRAATAPTAPPVPTDTARALRPTRHPPRRGAEHPAGGTARKLRGARCRSLRPSVGPRTAGGPLTGGPRPARSPHGVAGPHPVTPCGAHRVDHIRMTTPAREPCKKSGRRRRCTRRRRQQGPGHRPGRGRTGIAVTDGIEDTGHRQSESALRRELARRTAEVESLRAEVAALTAKLGARDEQVVEWRAKAAEYDALMQTKTMHAVRIPRAIYGRILARRAR